MSVELETKLSDIQQLAKDNPTIDASALMISALEQEHQDLANAKHRRWAYFVSLSLPPLGYGCALYYRFFNNSKDHINVAWWCAGLTTFSVALSLISLHVILNATTTLTGGQPVTVQQLQEAPTQLQQLLGN